VLYLFRNRAFVGGGMETAFFLDGKSVGILPQNGYFPIHVIAGRHKLRGCSSDLLASQECEELEIDMPAGGFVIIQVIMVMNSLKGPRITYSRTEDIVLLADSKNEGNYYDAELRALLPKSENKITLSAAALNQGGSAAGPLKIAILNFADQTQSNLFGWLSESLPDAIDQTMRRDFEYKRHAAQAGANVVISGNYRKIENDRIRIEAQVLYADTGKVLATEAVDSPVDAQIFNATKLLSDKLVAKLHEIVRKP